MCFFKSILFFCSLFYFFFNLPKFPSCDSTQIPGFRQVLPDQFIGMFYACPLIGLIRVCKVVVYLQRVTDALMFGKFQSIVRCYGMNHIAARPEYFFYFLTYRPGLCIGAAYSPYVAT